jgi:hypothetical protein
MPDGTDDHTKLRRRLHDLTRWLHNCLTKRKIGIRCQHEISQFVPAFCWHTKILRPLTKLLPEPEKFSRGHTMAQDGLTNGPML